MISFSSEKAGQLQHQQKQHQLHCSPPRWRLTPGRYRPPLRCQRPPCPSLSRPYAAWKQRHLSRYTTALLGLRRLCSRTAGRAAAAARGRRGSQTMTVSTGRRLVGGNSRLRGWVLFIYGAFEPSRCNALLSLHYCSCLSLPAAALQRRTTQTCTPWLRRLNARLEPRCWAQTMPLQLLMPLLLA
jgi:hypothetical protein